MTEKEKKQTAAAAEEKVCGQDEACEPENVTVHTAAEEAATENERSNDNVTGKFRNPEELARAYGELEKEFTRRSQRLAALENELQRQAEPYAPNDEEWKNAVDKFFEETPSAKPFAKDIARELISHPELKSDANCLNNALTRVLVKKFRTPDQLLKDGQFLNDYVLTSETVKKAVIEGYLQGVRAGLPPAVICGDGEPGVTPAIKPRSIEEAGALFLKNNK